MIRAWWSSRSSNPSPRHFVSGGRFDSYPLRHPRFARPAERGRPQALSGSRRFGHDSCGLRHPRRMKRSHLRRIPSVERVLQSLPDTGLPRPVIVNLVRRELNALRSRKIVPAVDAVVSRIRSGLHDLRASRIQPVINGTGILVHTNFGRAPLGTDALSALSAIGANYSNLEYDLTRGTRGGRATYLEHGLSLACGAEAATVVNNNAAALVLILHHFCRASSVGTRW